MENQEYEAVYENGVFKPLRSVSLPEKTRVVVSVSAQPATPVEQAPVDAKTLELLSRRYNSGHTDSRDESPPLSDAARALLDERIAEADANPEGRIAAKDVFDDLGRMD